MAEPLHIGISLGALRHFNDGLGEFSQRLCAELAARAPQLRAERGWQLHLHLPAAFHGRFADAVGYLGTHTSQRLLHLRRTRFALWHTLHQHIRLQAPLGTTHRLETVHDLNFLHLKQGAKQARYLRRMRARMARRDAVVAISGYVAGELRQALAPRTLPMRVFHGATDLTGVRQEPIEAIAALQAADPQRGFLLHISRLAPSKNIAALLELAAAWPEQPIVLAGAASSYTDAVRQQIAARGLQQVRLQLDLTEGQKAWAYAHCRGFLFPSLAEGFGAPPVEAMHFGKPVFLSRLTSLPEVGGEPAFFFDRFDDGTHLRAVVQAGLAAAAAPGYAERARAQARRHSWTACADAYLALYADLLAGAAGLSAARPAMLQLPDVTLVCVDTRTPALGLAAMQRSMAQVRFGAALLFTDAATAAGPLPAGITGIAVQIDSVPAYSQFMLRGLAPHLRTPQHLIVQWDSWVLDARCWDPAFAACDYIGALFRDGPPGRRVGNGGFSLRSQRLLQALQDPAITPRHPEDACICIQHRERLERVHGIRFADEALAARFAFERVPADGPTFGFHGLFNLHRVLSPEALHALVQQLPPGMGAGMDVRDLARALVREGRGLQLDTAALLVAMRRANGLRDRRTRALQLRLALARCLRRGRQPQTK